jgi:hypothetical protein
MTINEKRDQLDEDLIREVAKAISRWYVWRDGKFFSLSNLHVRRSKHDIQRECIARLAQHFPGQDLTIALPGAFRLAIDLKHADLEATIPVWDGRIACRPDVPEPVIWFEGSVTVNSWKEPDYRSARPDANDLTVVEEFLGWVLPRDRERQRFLDWLAWCLQNEAEKPAWAPFLYSANKGTGKSVLCSLARRLFGDRNTVVQNSVEKLTGRFNSTVLFSQLVICEEISLRSDSAQGNALKTYITERHLMSERKGQEAERVEQRCCFLFTSNHMPLWIEAHDRRYYLLEIDHEGHASGPRSREFVRLVEQLMTFLDDDGNVAALHRWLMERQLSEDFSARTLNIETDATALMERVHGASQATMSARLDEWLDAHGLHAVSEQAVSVFLSRELRASPGAARHMMTELRWHRTKAKWGGKDFTRAIWVKEGSCVRQGRIVKPDRTSVSLVEHLSPLGETIVAEPLETVRAAEATAAINT